MTQTNVFELIDYTVRDQVAYITLNRPHALNALSRALLAEINGALNSSAEDDAIRVIVLSGNGKAFSAGADLSDADQPRSEELLMQHFFPVFEGVRNNPKPVIASLSGITAGIAMSLALACDLVIMADDVTLWAPFSNLGLVPDGGLSWLLTRKLGHRNALATLLDAEPISANRAYQLGLAQKIVAPDELKDETHAWATKLATRSALATAHTKRLVQVANESSFEDVFAAEAALQNECSDSEYFLQKLNEFLNKSK